MSKPKVGNQVRVKENAYGIKEGAIGRIIEISDENRERERLLYDIEIQNHEPLAFYDTEFEVIP